MSIIVAIMSKQRSEQRTIFALISWQAIAQILIQILCEEWCERRLEQRIYQRKKFVAIIEVFNIP